MTGYETVVAALDAMGLIVRQGASGVQSRCPAHEDRLPSLSVSEGDEGKALVYCHAGCVTADVMDALSLSMGDLFVSSSGGTIAAAYVYTDESGTPLYRVLRLSPKGFFQERMEEGEWKGGLREVRRVLYNLPRLVSPVIQDSPIYIVEGEKDADNLQASLAAEGTVTTLLGGAGKWRDDYEPYFEDRDVVIIRDNDEPGRKHSDLLRERLAGVARSVRVLVPSVGKDVSDHLLAGLDLSDLVDEGVGLEEFGTLDWETYETVATEWLVEPYIPRQGRVLAFGAAGSLKSLWAMWVAAKLSKEGKRVAYFSLEMLPSDTAKRFRQLHPDPRYLTVFTRGLVLGSPTHTAKLIEGLKGFDLIVVDSWTAARTGERDSNEAVAALDAETIMPIVTHTGAALLILDNTGHAAFTKEGPVKMQHARGASAKGDKMEVTLWFDRPDETNNYRTTIRVQKMRLDYRIPSSVTVETPQDRIEFYRVSDGRRTEEPMWPNDKVEPIDTHGDESALTTPSPPTAVTAEMATQTGPTTDAGADGVATSASVTELTPAERRAMARLRDTFKVLRSEGDTDTAGQLQAVREVR